MFSPEAPLEKDEGGWWSSCFSVSECIQQQRSSHTTQDWSDQTRSSVSLPSPGAAAQNTQGREDCCQDTRTESHTPETLCYHMHWYQTVENLHETIVDNNCSPPTVIFGLHTSMKWGLSLPAVTLQTLDRSWN